MQVTETLNSGLKREIKVTVPASDMESRLMTRLTDARGKVRINGFRPGKVPVQHLRKVYGKSFMAEVVNEILSSSTREIIADRGEKSAMQPDVTMTEDEKEAEKVLAGQADFEFSIAYEIIPSIDLQDPTSIAVTRQVYEISDADVEEQVHRVAESARGYETKDGAAADGDRVTIEYLGKIDGEPFEGGADTDAKLVLGSKQFIPGFEDQLIGTKAGDEKTIDVTFPADYTATHLAGKDATFDIVVKEVAAPGALEINDDLAKNLGLDTAEKLREIVKGQVQTQFGALTRQKVKRELLDALDKQYQFEAPSKLVEAEFGNIWSQVTRELEQAGRSFADEETTEEAAREDYRKLAERRVRLGLVLSEIGDKAGVQVTEEELQRALFEYIRRFPGQEQQIFDMYRNNPQAMANFRAPLFEEKVVDHLLGQVSVTDKPVSKEELLAEDGEEKLAGDRQAAASSGDAPDDTAGEDKPAKKKAASRKKAAASADATDTGAE